jgi:hypothetical protein
MRFAIEIKQTRTVTAIVEAESREQLENALMSGGELASLLDELQNNPCDFEDACVEQETDGEITHDEHIEIRAHAYVNAVGEFVTTR